MSTTALTWAFLQTCGSATNKAVLVALADQARDQDANELFTCWPSQELIAQRTELGVRTVRRALVELEQAGYLLRRSRFNKLGHRTSDEYQLLVEVTVGTPEGARLKRPRRPPARAATGQGVPTPPATDDRTTGQSGQVTIREPTEEPSRPSSSSDDGPSEPKNPAPTTSVTHLDSARARADNRLVAAQFDQFWEVYPRHEGKAAALAKFKFALNRVSFEDLLAGAERYRDDPNRDQAYTKHPSTWLNQGCWEDDPLPPRGDDRRTAPAGITNYADRRPQW